MSWKIGVVVLNWNGRSDTLDCLASLERTTYVNKEVVVVDNGSSDDSVAAISERFPAVAILEMGENLGFAEGNNRGVALALQRGADLIFLLNNDTVVSVDLFEPLVAALEAFPQAGVIGSMPLLFDQREILDHLGGRWNKKTGRFDFIGHREHKAIYEGNGSQEIDYVCGVGMMIRREVIEAIGYLEPRYFLIWEESDFCLRAKKAGFSILTCPASQLWHKVSASFLHKPHSTYFWWRNRLLWIERNCSYQEWARLGFMTLLPEIFHLLKIAGLKAFQIQCLKLFSPQSQKLEKKRQKLFHYQAALRGIVDYCLRRFGNAPSWILTQKRIP